MNSDMSLKTDISNCLEPPLPQSSSILQRLKEVLRGPAALNILQGVSGRACCGEMVGLMGPSGRLLDSCGIMS